MSEHLPRYSKEEFSRRGSAIYEREVLHQMREDDDGRFVAIDIESGEWKLDADDFTATELLLQQVPDAQIWLVRVGSQATYRIGGPRRAVGVRMIAGTVNALGEPTIRIVILDKLSEPYEIDAVVDTGFNGSLTLPSEMITALKLTWRTRGSAILANGSVDECDIYSGIVMWDGQPRNILVEAADTTPLVGMRLMSGYRIVIEDVDGGQVILEKM